MPNATEHLIVLHIFNTDINAYYDKRVAIYNVYMFPEFKYNLYLPFKYTDRVPIQCIYDY